MAFVLYLYPRVYPFFALNYPDIPLFGRRPINKGLLVVQCLVRRSRCLVSCSIFVLSLNVFCGFDCVSGSFSGYDYILSSPSALCPAFLRRLFLFFFLVFSNLIMILLNLLAPFSTPLIYVRLLFFISLAGLLSL